MGRILVSIITVSYNSETTIARTIESVLNQSYDCIEYIIVDGNSKDRTVKIAESYRKEFEKKGVNYIVISEPDKGMYDALNKGAQMASGKLVGQINADDWYESNAIESMVDLFVKEDYDVAWGSIRLITKSGNVIKTARIGKLWTTTHWCHPGMFSRREVLLDYPYALETMYDDFDYITTVFQAGKHIVTTSKIIANFTFGEGGKSTKRSIREAWKRVNITYSIYRKHNMSRLYWLHRLIVEGYKLLKR